MLGLVGGLLIVFVAVAIWIGSIQDEDSLNNYHPLHHGAVVSNGIECAKIGRYLLELYIPIYELIN